ncbi:MAG: two-component regulator propeller domain-containing protein [Ferruginibacter sp.]
MLLIKKIPLVLLLITGINCAAQFAGSRSFKLLDDNRPFKINTLFKTREGYIYAGTTNGLYSFDGKNFKLINTNTPAIKDTVTAVFEDNRSQIWVGYKSGRLAKKTKSLLQYFEPEEGTPKVAITAFLQDKQNNIWFATNGEGIYYFYNSHLYLINEEEGLSDKYVHALALAANGDVLAATDQGINICSINGANKKIDVLGPKNGLPDYYITAIQPAGNNSFLIGLQEKGFCFYNHSNKQITIPAAAGNWNYGQVNALLYTQNNVWIATEANGLMKLPDAATAAAADFITSTNKNNINNLLQDNEGNIWMTTTSELISTAGDKLNLLPIYDKAVYETIHTILSDYQNNIWAGTDGGIIKYTRSANQWTSRLYPIKGLTSFTDITGLYQDMYHNIWLSTMGEGIFVVDPVTGKYRNISENPLLKKASILSITGTGNTVCAGGLEGVATIFQLSELNVTINANYTFTNYDSIPNVGNNYIHTVFKDSKGRIWFGTDGKGITVLEKGRFKHFDKTNGLKDEHVYSFTEDKKGCIWFNTKDAGVYCYNDTVFKNFGAAQGISDLKITTIKTDRLGNLIIVNENGIDILDPVTGTIAYINNNQGITGVNTAIESVCTDIAGNILLSTENGILVYTPSAKNILRPKTIIDNIQLFLKEIDPVTDHHFKYDENSFTFNFTGLYYTNPEQVHYQYKLEGLDTSWVSTKDQSIPFPNLRPGKYVFHVRSSLNDNFNNADEVTYTFVIETPFWKRIWFIILSILIVGGLLYWYMKSREKHLNKMQLLHQEKVEFQFQVLRNQVNPHFLFNSFNTLISTIEDNPKAAVDYVEQLSEFFRNIVNYRDKDVISLGEELQLMNTYFYLQQKRYGNSLVLKIDISDQLKKDCFVPPLTLQLLVENAIKHNAVSKESILSIHLYTETDSRLLISNNINPKISPEKGTGMGLQNIINRYNILSENSVLVNTENGHFTVSLPILKK